MRLVRMGGNDSTFDMQVRKAVIPIAGLGTRHFPASHAVKKELFPVVGADGIARALFHYHLLELDAAGIEEICIIVQPGEDATVKNYLRGPDANYLKRLEKYPALLHEAAQMKKFSERVTFAVQHTQEGFCERRNGFARPRRPFVSRLARFAVSRTREHGESFQRQKCFRREPHFGR